MWVSSRPVGSVVLTLWFLTAIFIVLLVLLELPLVIRRYDSTLSSYTIFIRLRVAVRGEFVVLLF